MRIWPLVISASGGSAAGNSPAADAISIRVRARFVNPDLPSPDGGYWLRMLLPHLELIDTHAQLGCRQPARNRGQRAFHNVHRPRFARWILRIQISGGDPPQPAVRLKSH